MLKQLAKAVLARIAPQSMTALLSARARAHSHRLMASWGCHEINRKLVERLGSVVQAGPFAGLTLTPITHAEHLGPYLLGVYESELDAAWEIVFRGTYPQIIDVGAKFGYYAVGLAKRFPNSAVVAFDTDWWARKALKEMAAENGVENLSVKGFCSPQWLERNLPDGGLIISDCEGYEAVLFDAGVVSSLQSATLIIETHDCLVPKVSDRLKGALGGTHKVRAFGSAVGRRNYSGPLDFLSQNERRLAGQEVRASQDWLLCLPTTGPNQSLRFAGPETTPCRDVETRMTSMFRRV